MVANRKYANPFHETLIEYVESIEERAERASLAELDHKISRKQVRLQQYPEGMTRQQAFLKGYITVHDLDDEELRLGRCRAANGKIPKVGARTEMIPRALHEAMVAEHLQRSNEKLRGQLDVALATMVDIMQDDTCEPKDRMDAAKYLYERVAGKTPERVQVAIAKAPWEEVLGGIAQISRAESRAIRNGQPVVDAEVVEEPQDSAPVGEPAFTPRNPNGYGNGPSRDEAAAEAGERADEAEAASAAPTRPRHYDLQGPVVGDPRIKHHMYVPGHEYPQNNSATAPLVTNTGHTNSEILRDEESAAKDLAARRKAARKRIQDAKKRRAIARATGQDAKSHNTIELTESDGKIQFRIDG